jgi:hypothetical protein
MLIETSDEYDWFDEGLLNSMYGQTQCCIKAMTWTSDWNGENVSKRVVSSMVSDMCPYFEMF